MSTRRYTEEQFRTALDDPEVRTMADLCRAVGIVPRGANYDTLRAYGHTFALDIDRVLTLRWLGVGAEELAAAVAEASSLGDLLRRFDLPDGGGSRRRVRLLLGDAAPDASKMPVGPDGRRARRSYTDEQLLMALGQARNYGELCDRLGLQPRSGTIRRLRERSEQLGSPVPAHWSQPGPVGADGVRRRPRRPAQLGPPKPAPQRFDAEGFRAAVAVSTTVAEALRRLGHEPSYMTRRWFIQDLRRHGVETSHFLQPRAGGGSARRPIEEILVRGRPVTSSHLRRRLIDEGLKPHRCEICNGTAWNGQPISLELDHIDGDRTNNTFVNLRLLCPNCHAQTPTYRGRNIGRRKSP